ncbi:uncharacterized protein BO87DRAFT_229227 [Aspergillus neoniger CBS 115656]|uniref:Uncharacterized protein n=1 Tax=Aspergillus neoniger (strain CBS 115656) TaxID=1448310 RepID=A0A318YPS9_ASPNB|nr:hypothetical protein BO87DRAFT_229227 [Aspergillus neoniger CBS 115656]PYH36705.1 hypothetical protein BO87DRAFT_229227 [Aspergillus neoniger CBS 115656]
MASSQLSQAERFTEVNSDVKPTLTARGLFSGPEPDDDPNLEMYEVAGRVVFDWHCSRWILWGSDATASMASTPHMALFPHSR